jgi:hypothetical protein
MPNAGDEVTASEAGPPSDDQVAAAGAALSRLEAQAAEDALAIPVAQALVSQAAEALADPADAGAKARFAEANDALRALRDRATVFTSVVIPEARERLSAARAEAEEKTRLQKYLDAQELGRRASRQLERDYPAIAEKFVALLNAVVNGRLAVMAANAALPAGFGPIADPEAAVRDQPTVGRQIVRDEVVRRWVFPNGNPLSDEQASRVHPVDSQNGMFRTDGSYSTSNGHPVQRASFRRIEFYPEVFWRPCSRLADTAFPGLRAGEPDYWRPGDHMTPQAIAAILATGTGPQSPALAVELVPLGPDDMDVSSTPPLAPPTVELIAFDGGEVQLSSLPLPPPPPQAGDPAP